jgi:ABC-type lipoprotein export system ATPase subunit
MIVLEHVSRRYDATRRSVAALRDVSLRVNKGEFVAIVGASGSGKSTLLQLIGCLDVPNGGKYELNDIAVAELDDSALSRLRNRHIGFVFQSFNLIARTTAIENVELPMCYGPHPPDRARAMAMLTKVGMSHRADHFPSELSGGEQQRVAIARALVNAPDILLADEPTGNLDAATGAQILQVLTDLHRSGLTLVLVTHDDSVARLAERTITLRDGEIVSDTTAKSAPALALQSQS